VLLFGVGLGSDPQFRFVPVHGSAQPLIEEYLALAGHAGDVARPLFRPVRNNQTEEKLDRPLDPASVCRYIVRKYMSKQCRRGRGSFLYLYFFKEYILTKG
jgi:hypothetical protein